MTWWTTINDHYSGDGKNVVGDIIERLGLLWKMKKKTYAKTSTRLIGI